MENNPFDSAKTERVGSFSRAHKWSDEIQLKELLRVTNTLCGQVFVLCRKDVTADNLQLASLATDRIKDVLRLFERHQ